MFLESSIITKPNNAKKKEIQIIKRKKRGSINKKNSSRDRKKKEK